MIEMNDEVSTLFEYLRNGIHYIYQPDREILDKIATMVNKIGPFEQPDMILQLDDKVMAIEHFEFDASSSCKKGSLDKRRLADRNRAFDKLISESDISVNPLVINTSVNCTYTANDYITNFKNVFEKHCAKVSDYKAHLVTENKVKNVEDIIICFFIVDTTPLGSYYYDDGPKSLIALQVKECLELINSSKEVDCYLFGNYNGKENALEFISNCDNVVQLITDIRIIDFAEDEFFTFNPQESRYCMKLDES